jgi:NADH-quinone oxidoreductase subunit F
MNTLESIVARHAPQKRSGLLPALQEAQVLLGWLSAETITQIARGLGVPQTEAYGVVKYYSLLYTEPAGPRFVRVCDDVICRMAGALQVLAGVEAVAEDLVTIETVPCLGACHRAPAVLVDDILHESVAPESAALLLDLGRVGHVSEPEHVSGPHLLRDLNAGGLHAFDRAQQYGRYDALRASLQKPPAQIIDEVKAAGLVGRGGAAFPTAAKWEVAAREIQARGPGQDGVTGYIICNGDESETGTFKDRILMEQDPHRLIESLAIIAYATGANRGLIYVRGEYPFAYACLSGAIDQARAAGLLGAAIAGTTFVFDLEMRSGAGAYICGEETAMLESIEGKRGEPRSKPPFPVTVGLFGRPTVINNVETLANVPGILLNGAEWYRQWGTAQSPGTRLVCLSGCVQRPGLYEISMGLPLRELLFDLGGGVPEGRTLQAVLVGGAAGAFLTPSQIDVQLDFQSLTAAGATFGSGAVMVFDDSVNLWDVLVGVTKFFAHESCGKCFPCQIGTLRQMEIVKRISVGQARGGERETLSVLGQTMRDASLCGLGQTASTALQSAIDKQLVSLDT